jgi:hypothetical protein
VLKLLLAELQTPKTHSQLARALGVSEDALEQMLFTLERGGYVGRAFSESPTCTTACAACSLKNLCPAAGAPALEAPLVWRLTALGEQAVQSGGQGG